MSEDAAQQQQALQEHVNALVHFIGLVYNVAVFRDPTQSELQIHVNELLAGFSPLDFLRRAVASDERRSVAKLYVKPGHFYSPVAHPAELASYVDAVEAAGPEIAGIAIDRAGQIALWERLVPLLTSAPFPETETPGFRYYYENRAYGFGDALILQAMIRDRKPKRLIEIGSGHSSACSADTVDRYLDGNCALTFIEPYPERLRGLLGDRANGVRIVESPVQQVAPAVFEELEAGDILLIDSTHVLRTGSDVCYELFEIMPRLAGGVAVHIHDMFWPFEYPRNWILDDNRSWNELYAVRAFLTENERWRILFFNDYFAKFEAQRIEQSVPRWAAAPGGSLWLERA